MAMGYLAGAGGRSADHICEKEVCQHRLSLLLGRPREEYWISGCKKDGSDALYSTLIEIDEDVREEYWAWGNIRSNPSQRGLRQLINQSLIIPSLDKFFVCGPHVKRYLL